jgi:hypothetical protein
MENKTLDVVPAVTEVKESLFKYSGKRGRPSIALSYPKGRFTVNELVTLNPHVKCRLSLYTHVNKLVKKGTLRFTGKNIAGKVGKPLKEIQTMASYRNSRAQKRNSKLRKLATVPVIDLTPTQVPVPVPVTVAA